MASTTPQHVPCVWKEWEFWAVLALLAVTYVVRFADFPLVGEETRVGRVTVEMIERNDWIVPRELGEPFNSRPPMMFWLIAIAAWFLGQVDVVAIRLPSLIGVVLTGGLIYFYARTWLSRTGGLLAALFWISIPELLIANRKAEAEALFTLGVAGSLMLWHAAYARGASALSMWGPGYALAAFATLIKGPQAPIYFGLSTWIFLIMRRQWRRLLEPGHFAGMAVYVLAVGAWVGLYCRAEGFDGFLKLWTGDTAMRFQNQTPGRFFVHLVEYPAEVFGCLLPWSMLLIFFVPRIRAQADSPAGHRTFLILSTAIAFLPCWFAPGAVSRYVQPTYPLLVVLMAWTAEGLIADSRPSFLTMAYWRTLAVAPVVIVAGLTFLAAIASDPRIAESNRIQVWVQPRPTLMLLAAIAAPTCWIAWRAATQPSLLAASTIALTLFAGVFATTAWVDAIRERVVPLDVEIARLKETLPPGQPAYRLGYVHHRFVYYNQAIPTQIDSLAALRPGECVCVSPGQVPGPPFPHGFELAATLPMDRFKDRGLGQVVYVLQRCEQSVSASEPKGPALSAR